jgi:magnesium chelatase family protein
MSVSRAALRVEYPAAFQLIAAMNPCPCGRLGDGAGLCRCTPPLVRRYRARVSGPLLDRLDMHVEVPRLPAADFDAPTGAEEGSAAAARRVATARALQLERQGVCNARLSDEGVRRWCAPDGPGARLLEVSMERLGLSGRARQRLLKLARTIADLEGAVVPGSAAVGEALMLRCLDRESGSAIASNAVRSARGAISPSAPCNRHPA